MSKAVFPNSRALQLAHHLMQCKSLDDVVALLRRVAATLPVTKPGASQKKRNRKASRRAGVAAPRGWREEMLRLADALERGVPLFSIFAMHGNMKLPFVAFSALPFVTCPGMGSCEGVCYSRKAWRTPGGYLRQFQNTALLLFAPRMIIDAFKVLPIDITMRLYVDGDFGDMRTLRFWMNLLSQRPDIECFGYSKSWELLLAYPGTWPGNYTLNLSSGSKYDNDNAMVQAVMSLPISRNWFLYVDVPKTFMRKERGYNRYDDPAYHRAVRAAAAERGFPKVLSCTGQCGDCITWKGESRPACGVKEFGLVIVNGCHG